MPLENTQTLKRVFRLLCEGAKQQCSFLTSQESLFVHTAVSDCDYLSKRMRRVIRFSTKPS